MNPLKFLPSAIENIIITYKKQLEIHDKYSNCINDINKINYLTYSCENDEEIYEDIPNNGIHSVRAHINKNIIHHQYYDNFLHIYSSNSHTLIYNINYDYYSENETVRITNMFRITEERKERYQRYEEEYEEDRRERERIEREEAEEIKREKEKVEYELSISIEKKTIQIYENNKIKRENKRKNNKKYKKRAKKLSEFNDKRRKNICRKMKKRRKNCCKKYFKIIW